MRHVALVGVALLAVWAAGAEKVELGARWTGIVSLLPGAIELQRTRLTVDAALPSVSLRARLDWSGEMLRDYLGVVRWRWGQWSAEGRAAFSPYSRRLLGLNRTLEGVPYPQVSWFSPAPHLRYGWIRGGVPVGPGELSVRLHHRVHHSWDVERLAFLEVVALDKKSGRWHIIRPELEAASRVAFVARGLRISCADGTTYTDRYSLALSFDPREFQRPLRPAPEARAYLDARVGLGWSLDELFLEDVLVYFQYPYRTEVRLRWDELLGSEDLRVTSFWEDRGLGLAWRETELRLRGLSLGREAKLELQLWVGPEDPPRLEASIEGGQLWGALSWDAEVDWGLSGGEVQPVVNWEERGHIRAHVAAQLGADSLALMVEGASVECSLDRGWNAHAVLALDRPSAPRPAWYRHAGFRRLQGTWSWEDGRWALLREWDAGALELGVYTATAAEGLLSLTRWFANVEVELRPGVEVETAWVSDDPASEDRNPAFVISWSISL